MKKTYGMWWRAKLTYREALTLFINNSSVASLLDSGAKILEIKYSYKPESFTTWVGSDTDPLQCPPLVYPEFTAIKVYYDDAE